MSTKTFSRTAEVLTTLRAEILSGQYRPGERLPSERELATRFRTSRTAVREALKMLEQLGIASVNPGGVRVVPIEDATLEVLGPLMDLQHVPDIKLIAQLTKVYSLLLTESVRDFVRLASDDQVDHARLLISRIMEYDSGSAEALDLCTELGRFFMSASGNLVVRLIANGLRLQVADRLEAQGILPLPDHAGFTEAMRSLNKALAVRDADLVAAAMRQLWTLHSESLSRSLKAAGATNQGLELLPSRPSRGVGRKDTR